MGHRLFQPGNICRPGSLIRRQAANLKSGTLGFNLEIRERLNSLKTMGVLDKVRSAEMKIADFVKQQADLGRTLFVDNAVAAFVGNRASDEFGAMDVVGATNEFVIVPFTKRILEYENAGKKARTIRLSVQKDRVQIAIE